jgi:hypothetical protein
MKREELDSNYKVITDELHYTSEYTPTNRKNAWIQTCLFNDSPRFENELQIINEHLENSKSTDDFYKKILTDDRLKMHQGYAELSKAMPRHWDRVKSMFGDKQFKASSDAGGLKIGNENFDILIPNRLGDGTTIVAIFDDPREFNSHMLDYFTSIYGTFNIYDYDCGNEVLKTISGRYGVYCNSGFIALVKRE